MSTLNPRGAEELRNQTTITESLRLQNCWRTALSKQSIYVYCIWYVCLFICKCIIINDKQQLLLQNFSEMWVLHLSIESSRVQYGLISVRLTNCWLTGKSNPRPDRCFCMQTPLKGKPKLLFIYFHCISLLFSLCFISLVALHWHLGNVWCMQL